MAIQTVTTWRTARPFDRDAVVLQIIKYEFDDENNERHSFVLALEPEPHWVEYGDGYVIMPTLEFTGLDMIHLFGRNRYQWPSNFDPREVLEASIDERVKAAVAAVMELQPAVEFTDG